MASLSRFLSRNRVTAVTALVIALLSSGTAAATTYLVLGTSNTAGTTTTLKSGVNGTVLSVQNTNATGGTSARGLSITVPAGRPPIIVNSTAGKAANLNADKLDGIDSTGFARRGIDLTGNIAISLTAQSCGQLNFGVFGAAAGQVATLSWTGTVPPSIVLGPLKVVSSTSIIAIACNVGLSDYSASGIGIRLITFR